MKFERYIGIAARRRAARCKSVDAFFVVKPRGTDLGSLMQTRRPLL